jgi:cellobiose phosphorylase
MYTYLTGSASWYMLTLVTEVFGARGALGDLVLDPKLLAGQFDTAGKARIIIRFADRELGITYHNPERLDYGNYMIHSVCVDEKATDLHGYSVIIPRSLIASLTPGRAHQVEVKLQSSTQ